MLQRCIPLVSSSSALKVGRVETYVRGDNIGAHRLIFA